jgi:hypothetical protein
MNKNLKSILIKVNIAFAVVNVFFYIIAHANFSLLSAIVCAGAAYILYTDKE